MSVDGRWIQNAGSTLSLAIDGATVAGVTRLFIDEVGNNGGGDVTFALGSILDMSFNSSQQVGTWNVMSWEGTLTNTGLTLAAGDAAAGWSFTFVDDPTITNSNGIDTLQVSFVPEPGTSAMLLGGFGMLLGLQRRRRSRR